MTYVFRNNTIERFLPGDYVFSGYDDFSAIPRADKYLWWYQVPIKFNKEQLIAEVQSYLQRLHWVVEHIDKKPLLIITLECLYQVSAITSDRRLAQAIESFNNLTWSLAEQHINIQVIDFNAFLRQYAASEWIDWKFYHISQMIINPRLSAAFITWFAEQERARTLSRKKCLVLDLDNTLWGGILGEDGISSLQLDGDYPGKAYHYWQEGLKYLSNTGVILAICSKNNLTDVEALFAAREMPLRLEDFACVRVNWNDKASNLRAIAVELNIGLDSMVFVDDNPTERELIRQQLPMVVVPEWPNQPYELPNFYAQLVNNYFAIYTITEEDKNKTEQYRQNASRIQAQTCFTNMEDFLQSLHMNLTIREANEVTISRVAQMTQKTNQFNLTTKRYTEDDIRRLQDNGAKIFTLSVQDCFGDNGITGLMIITLDGEVDTFLLSCRVLGKGIERAFAYSVLSRLEIPVVCARFIPTEKNSQVAEFYEQLGFTMLTKRNDGAKEYEARIADLDLSIKDYYKIDY